MGAVIMRSKSVFFLVNVFETLFERFQQNNKKQERIPPHRALSLFQARQLKTPLINLSRYVLSTQYEKS